MESRYLTMDELNKTALEHFIYQPVNRDMITYLADAANNVISCDPSLLRQKQSDSGSQQDSSLPSPPRTPSPQQCVRSEDDKLPTLDEFITQLVVSSNVQVPTLMSTLVYLNRLKSKLQPMARGLRCTTHRIFLAALILAAKYLNDSSPKNKHWANYTNMTTDCYKFGFGRTEVNLMEKQLLFLLEWDLRITDEDLYRELDFFLEPLRRNIAERHAKKVRAREEKRKYKEMQAAALRYPSPPTSRGPSRQRHLTPEHARSASGGSVTPPELSYSSSSSSYADSEASSRQHSRATTPIDSTTQSEPNIYGSNGEIFNSPVEIVLDQYVPKQKAPAADGSRMLPYEISREQYDQYERQQRDNATKKRTRRGVLGRILGNAVTVR